MKELCLINGEIKPIKEEIKLKKTYHIIYYDYLKEFMKIEAGIYGNAPKATISSDSKDIDELIHQHQEYSDLIFSEFEWYIRKYNKKIMSRWDFRKKLRGVSKKHLVEIIFANSKNMKNELFIKQNIRTSLGLENEELSYIGKLEELNEILLEMFSITLKNYNNAGTHNAEKINQLKQVQDDIKEGIKAIHRESYYRKKSLYGINKCFITYKKTPYIKHY